jgi:hypothetical protein
MTAPRYRNAWLWLAVATVAIVSLARAEAGVVNASAYGNPVLNFLARHQGVESLASAGGPQLLSLGSAHKASVVLLHGPGSGTPVAMLPVLFIGLVAPLNLISPRSVRFLGRAPSSPALPSSFQRPPPAVLV